MNNTPISNIVIHCSATPNGQPFTAKDIDAWHKAAGFNRGLDSALFNRDLKHIGYHFVVLTDGTIQTGRNPAEVGAHVAGHNTGSIGICLIGTDRFTTRQWAAVTQLVLQLRAKYPFARVRGHRDFSPDRNGDGKITPNEFIKTCPGFDVADWMGNGMKTPAAHVLGGAE